MYAIRSYYEPRSLAVIVKNYTLYMEIKKILIFGAGVIGSVYAGKLALAGHRVSVLARNRRLTELQLNGLLLSENGKKVVKTNVAIISELKTDDIYDLIFVILRKDQLKDALSLLAQNRSKNFVFMVNTAEGYSDWIGKMGFERVIPAFPGAGGNRITSYNVCYTKLLRITSSFHSLSESIQTCLIIAIHSYL